MNQMNQSENKTLYESSFEHDNCGIGAIVNIHGEKSHAIVDDALKIVENLEHRAGKDGEGKTGDGVGILTQIPHKFFKKVLKDTDIQIGGEREYAVGMFFFPQNELKRSQARKMFEVIVEKEGLKSKLILQVHDELLVEAPLEEVERASAIVAEEMENAAALSVPLLTDLHTGDNWLEAKE